MNKNILTALWTLLIGLVVVVAVALILNRPQTEDIELETETKVEVSAHGEEETHEETTVAVDTTEPVSAVVVEETETELPSYSVEEMAAYVLDNGLNGDARKEALGENYEAVQKWLDENYVPPEYIPEAEGSGGGGDYFPTGGDVLTPSAGVCYFNGHMETYYNLPMGGVLDIMYSLGYSGDYWVRSDGCKMFGNYIMVAADFGWLPRGSVVLTSLGWGMVCDTGAGGSNWLDIATTW